MYYICTQRRAVQPSRFVYEIHYLCDVPLKLPPSFSCTLANSTPVTNVQFISSCRVNVTSKCSFFFDLNGFGSDAPILEVRLLKLSILVLMLEALDRSSRMTVKDMMIAIW